MIEHVEHGFGRVAAAQIHLRRNVARGLDGVDQIFQILQRPAGGETGILVSDGSESPGEARVLLRDGVFIPGQNMEYQKGESTCLLLPQGVIESGAEFELVRFREMTRDSSE